MATTTAKQRTAHPMSYYREMVKDMDDSQKLELVSILIESVKPAFKRVQSDACIGSAEREQARPEVKPAFKRVQSDACIGSAEREQARPEVKPIQTRMLPDMPLEEDFPDMDKELYTPEEAYELTMKDIKAIYDKEYAV